MAMFRKKPVTVEAHQVPDPSDLQAWGELAGWLLRHDCQALLDGPDGEVGVDALLIPTLEGTMRADVGDWIIRGVQGEFYPCKPDIFEVTYEVVEDGVPTWLAQAGQVRGEQVRLMAGSEMWMTWLPNTSHGEDEWVEVRAPRAVPAPETERVPWWEAKDRLGLAGDRFVEVGADDEGPWVRVVEGGTKLHSPVAPDGTVEVLKDGDR